MKRTIYKIMIVLFLVLCIGFIWMSESKKNSNNQDSQIVQQEVEKEEEKVYYFRTKKLKQDHYNKHGKDMGFKNADEYEKAADKVIHNEDALTKTEKEDGDYVFYIEKTNEFVILSKDGYIRTYFEPSAGKKYYDRQ